MGVYYLAIKTVKNLNDERHRLFLSSSSFNKFQMSLNEKRILEIKLTALECLKTSRAQNAF